MFYNVVITDLHSTPISIPQQTKQTSNFRNRVGAIDSIVDIIGTLLALHHLSISTVSCSPIPIGEGSVWTDHGQLPVPAFATMRLLLGMKVCKGPGDMNGTITGELVTPTAAALLRVLTGVADFENGKKNSGSNDDDIMNTKKATFAEVRIGRPPAFTPRFVGIGGGTKDFVKHPNIIRLIIGEDAVFDDGRMKGPDRSVPLVETNVQHGDDDGDDNERKNHDGNLVQTDDLSQLVEAAVQLKNHNETKVIETKNATTVTKEESKPVKENRTDDHVLPWKIDKLTLLQTNIDDITSEVLAYVVDQLLQNGAIDAWVQPIVMKKGRSAHQLNCLLHSPSQSSSLSEQSSSSASTLSTLMEIIFRHTTTLGVRIQRDIERAALQRKFLKVQTCYGIDNENARNGIVDVKIAYLGDEVVSMKAEFDHCKVIAEETGIPLKDIADDAIKKAREQLR